MKHTYSLDFTVSLPEELFKTVRYMTVRKRLPGRGISRVRIIRYYDEKWKTEVAKDNTTYVTLTAKGVEVKR